MSITSHGDMARSRLARVGWASLQYFAAAFAVGFVPGMVRVLWLEPRLGTPYQHDAPPSEPKTHLLALRVGIFAPAARLTVMPYNRIAIRNSTDSTFE